MPSRTTSNRLVGAFLGAVVIGEFAALDASALAFHGVSPAGVTGIQLRGTAQQAQGQEDQIFEKGMVGPSAAKHSEHSNEAAQDQTEMGVLNVKRKIFPGPEAKKIQEKRPKSRKIFPEPASEADPRKNEISQTVQAFSGGWFGKQGGLFTKDGSPTKWQFNREQRGNSGLGVVFTGDMVGYFGKHYVNIAKLSHAFGKSYIKLRLQNQNESVRFYVVGADRKTANNHATVAFFVKLGKLLDCCEGPTDLESVRWWTPTKESD